MQPQFPGEGRAKIQIKGDTALVEIPSKSQALITVFLGFWLCGWLFGELSALWSVLAGQGNFFLFAWLGLWTAGGAVALVTFLWGVAGYERVWVSDLGIRIERSIPFWSRQRIYDGVHVRNFRFDREPGPSGALGTPGAGLLVGFDQGTIAFDYGRETVRFGLELADADAQYVAERLRPLFGSTAVT